MESQVAFSVGARLQGANRDDVTPSRQVTVIVKRFVEYRTHVASGVTHRDNPFRVAGMKTSDADMCRSRTN